MKPPANMSIMRTGTVREMTERLQKEQCSNCCHWLKVFLCPLESDDYSPDYLDHCDHFSLSADYEIFEKELFWRKLQDG